jgi:hypothetical protein
MPQEFTVTLTDEEAAALSELAAHWQEKSLAETLRRVAVRGLDMELQIKAHDEREAAGLPPVADLDDGIPF